jgi:hypothetical protein
MTYQVQRSTISATFQFDRENSYAWLQVIGRQRPLCGKTGHSLAARRIRDVHDVRHRLVNRGALSLVIERESQHLTTDLSPNNRCTHESDFNSSNPALTEKSRGLVQSRLVMARQRT